MSESVTTQEDSYQGVEKLQLLYSKASVISLYLIMSEIHQKNIDSVILEKAIGHWAFYNHSGMI